MNNSRLLTYVIVFLVVAILGIGGYLIFNSYIGSNSSDDEKNVELVIANGVKASTSKLKLLKGETSAFDITVSNVAGVIEVKSSDDSIVAITPNSSDCNGIKCFFDATSGKEYTIIYNVTALEDGDATININLADLLTYDETPVTGSGSISVLVK